MITSELLKSHLASITTLQSLLEAAWAGDPDARQLLLHRYQKAARLNAGALTRHETNPPHDGDDVFQLAMQKLAEEICSGVKPAAGTPFRVHVKVVIRSCFRQWVR